MKIIVGLGNPGKKYAKTRHNLGFRVVEQVSGIRGSGWRFEKKIKSAICQLKPDILLVKPQTHMNNSGEAVKKILRDYDIGILSDLWVVHDDLDLPFGKLRIQRGGSSAGHLGVESIMEALGSGDFVRFRVGIGRPAFVPQSGTTARQAEEYVLEKFSREEEKVLGKVLEEVCEAMHVALDEGIEKAMNKFN